MRENFSNKLKYYRKEKGITLKELSIKTDVSVGYLSHLETGGRENPSLKVMSKIAKALGQKIDELF